MKKFDVDLVEKKAVEMCNKAKVNNDLPTLHVLAIVAELFKAGIVDEAEKEYPDPIIEVWEKYRHLSDMFTGIRFASIFWNAIEKYAEGKGKV
jgi:hypothetical protein